MISLPMLLALLALGLTVAAAAGKVPLWAAVFVLCLIELLAVYPR